MEDAAHATGAVLALVVSVASLSVMGVVGVAIDEVYRLLTGDDDEP
jgi:hypothetical protein